MWAAAISALQEALTLAGAVAQLVIVHRGPAFTAQAAYRDAVAALANATVRYDTVVEEVLGEDGLTAARLRDKAGAVEELPVDGFFAYVGLRPNTDFLLGLLQRNESGRILTDASLRTSCAGVFAAGSVRAGAAVRAAAASGEGAAAAIAADRHLSGGEGG